MSIYARGGKPTGKDGRYLDKGSWWVSIRKNGKQWKKSARTRDRQEAEAFERELERRLGLNEPLRAEEMAFEDLAEGLLLQQELDENPSIGRTRHALKHLRRHLGHHRAADIDFKISKLYVAARRREDAANNTIRNETSALRRALNLAVKNGDLPRAPKLYHPKPGKPREGFLTRAEVDAICRELRRAGRSYVIGPVRFAFLTGWRKGEVLSLRWSNVDWEAGEVRLDPGTTKNGEGRVFPFHAVPELEELLEARREATRGVQRGFSRLDVTHVFHRHAGQPLRSIRGAWNSACRKVGLRWTETDPETGQEKEVGAQFHDMRRSAIMRLERAGVSRSVAMSFTGHKTESVYKRYAIVDSAAQADGARKLAQLDASATPAERAEGA